VQVQVQVPGQVQVPEPGRVPGQVQVPGQAAQQVWVQVLRQ
jgi:hypothetical protein